LGFSGRAAAPAAVVEAVTELPDGCLAVEHSVAAQRSTIYLCVPRWAFPFAVGSEVAIHTSGASSTGSTAEVLTVVDARGSRRLELLMNAQPKDKLPTPTLLPLEGGHATRCGAYVENLGLETATGVLAAGEMTDAISGGVRTRVLLGRAERVVVAPSTCEPERASLGTRFDLLTVSSLETDP
jgi:hypothetical protein